MKGQVVAACQKAAGCLVDHRLLEASQSLLINLAQVLTNKSNSGAIKQQGHVQQKLLPVIRPVRRLRGSSLNCPEPGD